MSEMLKEQIEEILKEYSGMDFCGKKECAHYDLCVQATQAIENLIVKSRVEAKAREEVKARVEAYDDGYEYGGGDWHDKLN